MSPAFHLYRFCTATLLIMVFIIMLFSACASPPRVPETGEAGQKAIYQLRIETLLRTFDSIVSTSEALGDIENLYSEVRKNLTQGNIRFVADTGELSSSLRRSRFTLNRQNGMAVVFFHSSLLDEIETNPVPALGEYAGLLANLRDYQEYGSGIEELYTDPLEFYLANMDRSYLQAQFLKDYAIPLYGREKLGEYEYYLLQSLEVDGFSSHSLFVWGIDKDIVYSMLGLSTQLGRGQVDLHGYVEQVLQLGNEIRDNFEQSRRLFAESGEEQGDDGEIARRNMYIAATSANSYRTLGSVIFSSIVNVNFGENEYREYSIQLEEIDALYSLFEVLLTEVTDFRREYRKDYLSGF